jgi:2-keto-4-pentenoate hydratase
MIVLAGAATAAVQLKPEMKIELKVENLPQLQVSTDRG